MKQNNIDNLDMQDLVKHLNECIHAYYILDTPIVSDAQFDEMYARLVRLESESGVVLSDSPTSKVGAVSDTKFAPHTHINRLFSLDKVNSYDELVSWASKLEKKLEHKVKYTCEYKIDGLTLCLTYNQGKLVKAATRGNGIVGETVTPQVMGMSNVPKIIDYTGTLEVQGEGHILLSDLAEYNATHSVPLKNARNGVAGAIRNLDPQVANERKANVFFYNINFIEDGTIDTHTKALKLLKDNNFVVLDSLVFEDINDVVEYIKSVDRDKLDFLIDGMVIKVDDYASRLVLGNTDKFPRWAVAFKFEALEYSTKVLDIVWQVGRTGKLTPMAHLEPVDIGGATVKRATLNNIDDINRKGVGVGSTVFVRRSNDVIPEILYAVDGTATSDVDMPSNCPICDSILVRDGVHIFCKNESCPKIVCGKIEHWVSKDCMDIDGISGKTIELLYQKGMVKSFADLYKLKPSDFDGMDGFGSKKIDNLLKSINASKTPPLYRLLNALGINGIGKKTAQDLENEFKDLETLSKANFDQLCTIPEIGETMANSIVEFFKDEKNITQLELLKQLGIKPKVQTQIQDGSLTGKKLVITGTLSLPRSHFSDLITKNGGTVSDSISKNIDYLLAGDSAGSKLEKAEKLGIKVLSEEEFYSMLNS